MTETLAGNLVIQGGKILLLHRSDKDYWELPGGKVEDGEFPREAAKREAEEEIGCEVEIRSPVGRMDLDFEHDGEKYSFRGFYSEIVEGSPSVQEGKFSKSEWFDEEELEKIPLAPNIQSKLNELRLLLKRSG